MNQIVLHHFITQQKRFERASLEFGVIPILSYILIFLLFITGSLLLLTHGMLGQASYVVPMVVLHFMISHSDRLKFFKQIYSKTEFSKIRWIENIALGLPFLIILLYKSNYIISIVPVISVVFFSVYDRSNWLSLTLPTPFYKYPFEFTSGFRFCWVLTFGLYALIFIACNVGNEALAFVSVVLLTLSSTLYYQYPELEYFIWIHNVSSKEFLKQKIKIAMVYSMLIIFPALVLVVFVWPSHSHWFLLGVSIALLFLSTNIVAKYTMYPSLFNLPLVLLLSLGLMIPPLLLFIFPYLLRSASQNLKPLLP